MALFASPAQQSPAQDSAASGYSGSLYPPVMAAACSWPPKACGAEPAPPSSLGVVLPSWISRKTQNYGKSRRIRMSSSLVPHSFAPSGRHPFGGHHLFYWSSSAESRSASCSQLGMGKDVIAPKPALSGLQSAFWSLFPSFPFFIGEGGVGGKITAKGNVLVNYCCVVN